MATAHDNYEKGLVGGDIESGSDDKGRIQHVDHDGKDVGVPAVATATTRTFEAPEYVRNMTREQRIEIEGKLKRKIDIRLMPMIVLMYIMNYRSQQYCGCETGGYCSGFEIEGSRVPGWLHLL